MTISNTDSSKQHNFIKALPCWSSAVSIEPLEGGITNHNYIARTNDGVFVVRLGKDIPEHHIKRSNEIAAGKAAHAAGISPQIRYYAEGVLVMDFIDSQALTEEKVRTQSMLTRIIELLKRCHLDVAMELRGAPAAFWVFHVIRDYAATLKDGNSAHIARLATLLSDSELLQQAASPFDIVFSHNDLLAANILDDGNKLWLIDWEYAGFNTPLFDLGGLASNNGLDETLGRWMLELYFEAPVDDGLWRRYSAMKCASLLRETMWSMVSELHSTLDFDYGAYTEENLTRYSSSLAEFKHL